MEVDVVSFSEDQGTFLGYAELTVVKTGGLACRADVRCAIAAPGGTPSAVRPILLSHTYIRNFCAIKLDYFARRLSSTEVCLHLHEKEVNKYK